MHNPNTLILCTIGFCRSGSKILFPYIPCVYLTLISPPISHTQHTLSFQIPTRKKKKKYYITQILFTTAEKPTKLAETFHPFHYLTNPPSPIQLIRYGPYFRSQKD